MGLALGIDYSLFVVSRYREERARGRPEPDAIAAAGATASRAVLFSGSVFVIALSGMLLVPSNVMKSLAVGALTVGIVSVLAALTLLPALLGRVGDGVKQAARALVRPEHRCAAGRAVLGCGRSRRHAEARGELRRVRGAADRGGSTSFRAQARREWREHASAAARVGARLQGARADFPQAARARR